MLRGIIMGLLALLVIAGGVSGFIHMKNSKAEAKPRPAQERVWTVPGIQAAFETVQPQIKSYGTLVAGRSIDLRPLVTGQLVEVSDKMLDGTEIQAGDILAKIDPFDYQIALRDTEAQLGEARARKDELEAQLEGERALLISASEQTALRQKELDRARSLASRGVGATMKIDESEIRVNEAMRYYTGRIQAIQQLIARIAQQDATVDRLTVHLDRAKRDLDNTTITAPFSGFLSNVNVALGSRVSINDQLAKLIDVSRIEVRFELPNREFSRLISAGSEPLVGRSALVRWAIGEQSFDYPARIDRVDAEIDANTGGVGLFAALRADAVNKEVPVRPGAFVEVIMDDRSYENVLRLPGRALGSDNTVYVLDGEGRIQNAQVQIMRRVGRDVLVASDLDAGAWVVTTRFPEIGPGAKVTIAK